MRAGESDSGIRIQPDNGSFNLFIIIFFLVLGNLADDGGVEDGLSFLAGAYREEGRQKSDGPRRGEERRGEGRDAVRGHLLPHASLAHLPFPPGCLPCEVPQASRFKKWHILHSATPAAIPSLARPNPTTHDPATQITSPQNVARGFRVSSTQDPGRNVGDVT